MAKMLRLFLAALLLAGMGFPVLPERTAKAAVEYPSLPSGFNYYQVTYPSGLRYSKDWYGTFTSAPKIDRVYLIDDQWAGSPLDANGEPEFGRAIIGVPPAPNKQPSGPQGGTMLTPVTQAAAQAIVNSYNLDAAFKPWDAEILAVMEPDHAFVGACGGAKLAQKHDIGDETKYPRPPPEAQTQRQKDYIRDTAGKVVKQVDLEKYDPDRFWVGGTGSWSDNAAHWAASSGGAPGASLPTSADSTFIDVNSGSGTITVDVTTNGLSFDMTGASGITFAGSSTMNIYGNFYKEVGVTWTYSGGLILRRGITPLTATFNGPLNGAIQFGDASLGVASTRTLLDDLTIPTNKQLTVSREEVVATGITITCGTLAYGSGGSSSHFNITNSIVNVTNWNSTGTQAVQTFTSTGSTVNVSSTSFAGNGHTFNIVNLNGSAHTISGNNTFAALNFQPSGTQTITATGTNQTAASFSRTGTGQITFTDGAFTKTGGGTVSMDYVTPTGHTGSPASTFIGTGGSVDGGGNTDWSFPLTTTTTAASGVSMDKDGVVSGNFTGTITDMGGSATVGAWFAYGLTASYGSTTTNVTWATGNFTGSKAQAVPTNLTPGQTWHFARYVTSGANTTSGGDQSFTLTMPTVTTGSVTRDYRNIQSYATLSGTLDSLGVASDAYINFNWGYAPGSLTNNTTLTVFSAPGSHSVEVAVNSGAVVYYQISATVGAVTTSGSVESFTSLLQVDNYSGVFSLARIVPTILLVAFVSGSVLAGLFGFKQRNVELMFISLILLGVGIVLFTIPMDAINAVITR